MPVEIDPGQLEQVLVNLAVNARDAMPDGGRLLIEVEPGRARRGVRLHAPGHRAGLLRPAQGQRHRRGGMDAETVERVFEPFFTTKEEGTGLGLATVYGIVTGAGGRIDVYSEPGIGTTMKIHLPVAEATSRGESRRAATPVAGQGEVVLVVEDEPEVRRMAERILAKAGYSVLGTCGSGGARGLRGPRSSRSTCCSPT